MTFFSKKELKELRTIRDNIEQATSDLDQLHADAQERFEARSEKWRESETGETAQSDLSHLSDAADLVRSAWDELGNIQDIIE